MKLVTKDPVRKKHLAVIIFDRTIDYSAFLAGVITIFIMLTVLSEIISRTFLGHSILWVLEINQAALLFITFLTATWLLRKEGHVKMDLVYSRLKPRPQVITNIVTSFICAVICFIITWYGVRVTWEHYQLGLYIVSIVEIPNAYIIWIIPVGSFMLGIQFLRRTYGYLKSLRTPLDKEQSSP